MRIKKSRVLIAAITAFCAALLCATGIFLSPIRSQASVGDVFDYTQAEKTVKYKAYQSDPLDVDARKGLMLYAYDSGASVPFKRSFTGNFTAELTAAANEENTVETKRFSLLFTDVATGRNFSVAVINKSSEKNVCVVYEGEQAGIRYNQSSTYKMLGLTGEYNVANEYTAFTSQAAYITFDPELMEVKLRLDDGIDRTVWNFSNLYNDGKKLENDLPSFEEYTVSVVFDEINKNSKGEILIYSFGGYVFDTAVSSFKPTVQAEVIANAVVGNAYEIPSARVVDVLLGELDATSVSVDAYDSLGNKVNDGYSFTPTAEGAYYLYYTYEKDGEKATAYYAIEAVAADKVTTEYYFEREIDSQLTLGKNERLYLPKAAVESVLLLSSTTAKVTIFKDGKPISGYEEVSSGFSYAFTECGEYEIVYSVPKLSKEWSATETIRVTVDKKALGITLSEDIAETLALNANFTVPTAKMFVNGEELTPTAKLVFPSGKEVDDATSVLDETGTYTVTYAAGEYTRSFVFDVKETYADLFVGEGGDNASFEEVVANNETTGVKLTLQENEKYVYQKTIDLSDNVFDETLTDLSQNVCLVEMYAQPKKIDTPDVDALFIVLTDANNPDNYLEIRMKYISYSSQGVYIRTRASGQANWVGYNYDFYSTALAVHYASVHEEGGFYSYFSMTHNFHDYFETMALRLYFDNETKCLYGEPAWKYGHTDSGEDRSLVTPWLIRDFKTTDEELSAGNKPWDGFSTGEVIMSVYAKGVTDKADFYITEIDGVSLQNEFIEPSAPTLDIDMQGNATAAYALVGKPYKVPNYVASDDGTRIISESVEVRRVENGVLTTAMRIKNGSFTPAAAVTYAIVYKAVNAYGLETEKRVYVEAKTVLDALVLETDTDALPKTAAYGEQITLPAARGYGGAGWVNIEYAVENDGEKIEVVDGKFTCFGTGTFKVTIKAVDYVGQEKSVRVEIGGVAVSEKPVFDEENILLPAAFIVGDTFTFAEYTAVLYGKDYTAKPVTAKIEIVDGAGTQQIGADRKYTPTSGAATEEATVRFIFGEGANALTIEKKVPVLLIKNGVSFLANYFVGENLSKKTDAHNVLLSATDTNKDASFSFIRPVDSKNLSLKLGFNADESSYETVSVYFRDIYDTDAFAEIKLRFDGENVYASCNGAQEKRVTIAGGTVQICYSTKTREFTDSLGVTFGSMEQGFPNDSVYISVSLNGVYGASCIGVQNINNQTINLINRDLQKPSISLAEEMEGRYASGKTVVIPAATAYDVLNGIGEVTVCVSTESDGGKVYVEERAANEPVSFTPDTLGYYLVTYKVRDNAGNVCTLEKRFSVYDAVKPSITFKKEVPQTIAVGSSFALPEYVLSDNYSLNDLVVRIYFATPDGMIERVTGKKVTFERQGYYSLNYLVMDKNNNIMTYTFSIKAE